MKYKKYMKTKTKIFLLTIVFILTVAFNVNGQISISNYSQVSRIKSGTTYVAMKDPDSEKVKDYIDVFKNTWTASKIEFIKYTDIEKYISPESSFLTMGGYETTTQFTKLYNTGSEKHGINYANTHLYLELWTCKESYFTSNKKNKVFKDNDKIQVARIELYTDFKTLANPDFLFQSDYDGNGHIRNWGPGILKNYIQLLMTYLDRNKNQMLYSETYNAKEMKKLKNEVLYIPDYILIKFNNYTGDETQKHDVKDLFKGFNLKYKLLSIDELNQKILTDKTGFYYLIYIKSSTDKFVSIMNSLTGEFIYSTYSPISYNIKSKDFERIQKKAE
jgi:hypothetical protein